MTLHNRDQVSSRSVGMNILGSVGFLFLLFNTSFAHIFRSTSTGSFGLGVSRLQYKTESERWFDDCGNVSTNWFTGAVKDNFVAASRQEPWDGKGQRYFVNDQFWLPDCPQAVNVFVYIGGEGAESCNTLQPGVLLMSQLAEQHSALMVDVEHRFYGESYPTVDMSNDNLAQYLSSEQALADLARIIDHVLSTYGISDARVITFGGSYPGDLAAWFRLKYPQITHASVASSAPLRAELNFSQYMEVVTDALSFWTESDACNNAVEEAVKKLVSYADEGPGSNGYLQLSNDFQTCSPLTSVKDVSVLFSDLMGNIQGTVQYNKESRYAANVTNICDQLTSPNSSAYQNFIALSRSFAAEFTTLSEGGHTFDYPAQCEDASYDHFIDYLKNSSLNPNNNMRPWTYQTCNEFGYFQTALSPKTPWHSMASYLDTNFYLEVCQVVFGGQANEPDIKGTNRHYGSNDKIEATNVLFPNGSLDPWHVLGVYGQTRILQPTEHPLLINGTAHCADMRAMSTKGDSPLWHAQHQIMQQVEAWLLE